MEIENKEVPKILSLSRVGGGQEGKTCEQWCCLEHLWEQVSWESSVLVWEYYEDLRGRKLHLCHQTQVSLGVYERQNSECVYGIVHMVDPVCFYKEKFLWSSMWRSHCLLAFDTTCGRCLSLAHAGWEQRRDELLGVQWVYHFNKLQSKWEETAWALRRRRLSSVPS